MRSLALAALALLAGCATAHRIDTPSIPDAASISRPLAEPPPIALATRNPPTRLQSKVEQLSHVLLAAWILPSDHAWTIVGHELLRGRTGRVHGIALLEAPERTAFPQVCGLQIASIWLRVPNEAPLNHEQHLNPPLEPYQYTKLQRFRIDETGSCAQEVPYSTWFEAQSAAAAHRAARIVRETAQGILRPRLRCTLLASGETGAAVEPPCPGPRRLLGQLTGKLIRRVRPSECAVGRAKRNCLVVEYADPAAPDSTRIYLVTLPDEDRPAAIDIVQTMLPPH